MKKKSLRIAFCLAFVATLAQSALFPSLNFMTFAPFLVLSIVYLNFPKSLWLAFLAGIIIDLFSSGHMGLYALCYCLTTALLYRQKRNFIDEKPLNLALFTALISFVSTIVLILLLFIFDRRAAFSGQWAFIDLWTMPLLDALYAFVWFYCPFIFYQLAIRQWKILKIRYRKSRNERS